MKQLKVHENGDHGFQIEFQGVLLTIGRNKHHGISGTICLILPGSPEMREITFHGEGPDAPFPVEFHDETKDRPRN